MSNKDILKVRLKVRWITYRWREGEMIEDGEVRPEGCICKPCSDIQRYMKLGWCYYDSEEHKKRTRY